MAEEGARPAQPADLAPILALAAALRAELEPMRGGRIWSLREARPEPLEQAFASLLSDPDSRVVAGTIDGTVVGFGTGRVEVLTSGEWLGVIDELFVEAEAREVGVGEAILGDLVAFFRQRGCLGIDAFALPGHRATKNFFEESGFTARAILMHHGFQ